MVWQCESNGLAMHFEWFCNADRMVLQHRSNGFCNADRMVWQHRSNSFATQIEWFGNADRTPLQHIEWFSNADQILMQHALNDLSTRIEYFCNTHRIIPHPKRICACIVKVQSIIRMRTVRYNLVNLLPATATTLRSF